MNEYADLEIGVHRRAQHWSVDLRFKNPKSDADVQLEADGFRGFDFDALRQLELAPDDYGRHLASGLFASPEIRQMFGEARTAAQVAGLPLRFRLFVGSSAPELDRLRWETLRSPDDDSRLSVDENILFSRLSGSADWRSAGLRPKGELTALVVIANPEGDRYRPGGRELAPIDVAAELARAQAGLAGIRFTALDSGGRATLAGIAAALREGPDVLYLVCHGFLEGGESMLLLEDTAGQVDRVSGRTLIDELSRLQQPPRLVVLVSCQSGGTAGATSTDDGELAALGPMMGEAGVPAVIAMQGNVSMETVAAFMPRFFTELARDGQIDRAMAAGRGDVGERLDWWMPVLYMRLRSGRLWYAPGFVNGDGFVKLPALLDDVAHEWCTPVLGMGLTDSLIGSSRELARRWADRFGYPLDEHDKDDLPEVAQYVAVNQHARFVRSELGQYLRTRLVERFPDALPQDLGEGHLDEMLGKVWEHERQRCEDDPHAVLAELPFPVYITTHPSSLLETALRSAGKEPVVDLCRWTEKGRWPPPVTDYRPDAQHPLVFHMFGTLDWPETLVLTEDDYFDFLIGITKNRDLIPLPVRRKLADSSLLYLGFGVDEWAFRVLFRSIMNQESDRPDDYSHVAAQIDPEGRAMEPERARRYLEAYFQKTQLSIYWGTVDAFAAELGQAWRARPS